MQTLQQVVDERISFLKEQINPRNKPEKNKTFQLQMDAIRSAVAAAAAGDIEEVEAIIAEKKALLKNSNDVHEFDRLSAELEGLEWLSQRSKWAAAYFISALLLYKVFSSYRSRDI
jgi:hypothetical protein